MGSDKVAKDGFSATRRKVIKNLVIAGVGAGFISKAPYVFAKQKTKLRILGTHVTLQV